MQKPALPADDISRLAIYIFRINGMLLRNGDQITKPLGQSSARWQVLGIAADEPQTIASIARNIGHARQSVQRVADALTKDGLTFYQQNPADKRAKILAVCPQGMQVLREIYTKNQIWATDFRKKLDDKQCEQLLAGLEMVQQALSEQAKEVQ